MPRPRVRPADRQRAAKACNACKSSKKRCDANLPCLLCVQKGRAESCTYPDASSVQSWSPGTSRPLNISPQRASPPPRRQVGNEQIQQQFNFNTLPPTTRDSVAETRESSPQCTQRPTMLLSSRGEHVYIGNVASLSFLRFLQKTLKRYIGSSSFTDRQRSESMLEIEIQNGNSSSFEDDLEISARHEVVRCFLRVSNGILHLFSEEDISRLLALESSPSSADENLSAHRQRDDLACLYLMIAIGSQCRGADQMETRRAAKYFSQAQKFAFIDMLQDPSLGMIRIFLLMAMYMLGACRRNTAFTYIGIASKAATILGLHIPYQHVRASPAERAVRRRTWMSLRVLDLLCSSILGRLSSTPSIQRDEYETDSSTTDVMDHRSLALSANYESSSIIENIVQQFATCGSLDLDSAEKCLQMLREWSQALPDALRKSPKFPNNTIPTSADPREITIGNIHVACTYYFGVILVTRQFLIARVMSQLRGRRSGTVTQPSRAVGATSVTEEKTTQFSNGCIDSAIYMAQLCYEASKNNILLDNMCILKAWLFSAGLILGFSLLVEEDGWPNTRETFSHVRETLQKLARLSPQAAQYFDILTNFSNAIELYRQQILAEQRPPSNPYVERIMTLGNEIETGGSSSWDSNNQSQPQVPGPLTTPNPSHSGEEGIAMFSGDDFGSLGDMSAFTTQVGDDIGLQLIWDSYAMQLPDFNGSGDDGIQQQQPLGL